MHKYQSRRDVYLLPSLLGLSGVTNQGEKTKGELSFEERLEWRRST